MRTEDIHALVQYTNQAGASWSPSTIVPKNLLIYDSDNRLFKKGNGIDFLYNLPVLFYVDDIETIYNIGKYIDIGVFSDENIDKLLIITEEGAVGTGDLTLTALNDLMDLTDGTGDKIIDTIRVTASITAPIIAYPVNAAVASSIKISAKSINCCESLGGDLSYKWTLPSGETETNDGILEYAVTSNPALAGEILKFQCTTYMSNLDIYSKTTSFEITISPTGTKKVPLVYDSEFKE